MTAKVNIGREEFQSRKKRRIEDMRKPHGKLMTIAIVGWPVCG